MTTFLCFFYVCGKIEGQAKKQSEQPVDFTLEGLSEPRKYRVLSRTEGKIVTKGHKSRG